MTRHLTIILASVLCCTLSAVARAGDNAAAGADAALKAYHDFKQPEVDRSKTSDPQYVQDYRKQMMEYFTRRAQMAKEFYDAYPTHPEAPKMLGEHWMMMAQTGKVGEAQAEAEKFIAEHNDSPALPEALFFRALATMRGAPGRPGDQAAAMANVEAFIKAAPKDDRGAMLLSQLASREKDDAKKAALMERVIRDYPNSDAAQMAQGELRQAQGVGKPFELTFTDAISGKQIDVQKDLRGKVVVVDFWATWCGPCVAEMPNMKKIYAEYHPKGVEFVGISLDQPESAGGLTALKKYVAENQVAWPQYYQGNGWQSKFSAGWGINSIPCLFIVDSDGKLHSTSARGELEKLIPELLAKRDKNAAG